MSLEIQTRAYAGEADLRAIVGLQDAARALNSQIDRFTFETLRDEYNEPGFDISRNLRLWEAGGILVMFADMWIDASDETLDGMLYYQIRPATEDEFMHRDALSWGEARLREAAAEGPEHSGLRPVLRVFCLDSQAERLRLWPELGLAADRYDFNMQRDLHAPIPAPAFPAGFELRPLAGAHKVEQWVICLTRRSSIPAAFIRRRLKM